MEWWGEANGNLKPSSRLSELKCREKMVVEWFSQLKLQLQLYVYKTHFSQELQIIFPSTFPISS